ncbi:MAG: RNA 2',3'-cyclic phosphodiesterase [Defluviimonas sp.]|uniref:RNA 2',3'-cyclic phosphodiesterase n=1 Tax=Albidovulum sp. TaxID=1872424 RepID=UPI001E1A9477|nr:RNA 2',3'-cyclic phosphodiesterase [Paracoccaceae bacterium]MCC0062837.1 RNA 2',3'-cyclic phosphodiesterase [Defluviimonas sp.]
MRAFLALALPETVRRPFEALQEALPVGRTVQAENLHLTIAFLGEVAEQAIDELHFALDAARLPAARVVFDALAVFGGSLPQSLHAAVKPDPGLSALHARACTLARGAGIALERRRFRPHVTIARFAGRLSPDEESRLARFLGASAATPLPSFDAAALTLYRSTLTRDGAIHEALADYPLG